MRQFKQQLFLGNGETSLANCYRLYRRLGEALELLGAVQQPAHEPDFERQVDDTEDAARDIFTALTGKEIEVAGKPTLDDDSPAAEPIVGDVKKLIDDVDVTELKARAENETLHGWGPQCQRFGAFEVLAVFKALTAEQQQTRHLTTMANVHAGHVEEIMGVVRNFYRLVPESTKSQSVRQQLTAVFVDLEASLQQHRYWKAEAEKLAAEVAKLKLAAQQQHAVDQAPHRTDASTRIAVEVEESHYTVVEGETGLCQTKSSRVGRRIARALRIISQFDILAMRHEEEAQRQSVDEIGYRRVHFDKTIMTYPDGKNRCCCRICMLVREEQDI